MCVLSCSVVSISLDCRLLCPWGLSRQEYWSGLSCPPPGNIPNPGIKPRSSALQANSLPAEPPGKPIPNKMRYYLSITTNKIFIPNTTGMDLTNIMPSKRSNARETTYYVISFTWNVQNRQIYSDRKLINGCLGLGVGTGGNSITVMRVMASL